MMEIIAYIVLGWVVLIVSLILLSTQELDHKDKPQNKHFDFWS